MLVDVIWRFINERDPLWQLKKGLYAYFCPESHEILYIGKVDGTTVRQRWNRSAKADFWKDLEDQRGILKHAILVGKIGLPPFKRLTIELLRDIESLLILELKPWGNIQSRNSRISRKSFIVNCLGDWPLARKLFQDVS